MYLSTCTRWDIDYSVMPLTRAMTNLKGKHMVPAKRVLRYLEGTPDLCVRYSKKQPVVALSSCESEYIALASASQEAVYLSDLLSELTFPQFSSVQMYEDNMGALQLSGTTAFSSRTKHILRDTIFYASWLHRTR